MAHSHRNTVAHREVRDAARSAAKRNPQSRHCGGKRAYRNRAAAHGALAKLRARFAHVRLEIYHCRFCGQYHWARGRAAGAAAPRPGSAGGPDAPR